MPRAELWTPATEHVMLYCTWCQSALSTGLHVQVVEILHGKRKFLLVVRPTEKSWESAAVYTKGIIQS